MDKNAIIIKTLTKCKNMFKIEGVYSGEQIHKYINVVIKAIKS